MIHIDRPIDWTNISLGEYIELQDATLENGEDQEDIVMQQVQILYNKNPYSMSMPEFRKAVEGLKFMTKPLPKMKVKEHYMLNGNAYFLHKSLSDFKVGQYIDYERIMKEKKGIEAYAEFIALFLTPDPEQDYGDGYDVGTVVKDIRKYMSIADACSIAAFFLKLSKAYTVHFLHYSMSAAMAGMKDRKARKELKKKTRKLIRMVLTGELHHS